MRRLTIAWRRTSVWCAPIETTDFTIPMFQMVDIETPAMSSTIIPRTNLPLKRRQHAHGQALPIYMQCKQMHLAATDRSRLRRVQVRNIVSK